MWKKKTHETRVLVEKRMLLLSYPEQAGCALSIAVFKSSLFSDTHYPGKILNQDYGSDVCCALVHICMYTCTREKH